MVINLFCFEECKEETQDKWLDNLGNESLKRLAKQLGKTICELGEQFDIYAK